MLKRTTAFITNRIKAQVPLAFLLKDTVGPDLILTKFTAGGTGNIFPLFLSEEYKDQLKKS